MKKVKPQFFVMCKNFNGKMESIDVIDRLLSGILNERGSIKKTSFKYYVTLGEYKPVKTKEELRKYIDSELRYNYWGRCEYEFIAVDWPYRDRVEDSHPVKIDVYEQLRPNIPVITDLVWNYIEEKVNKL